MGGFEYRVLDLRGLACGWWNGGSGIHYLYHTSVLFRQPKIGAPGEVDGYALIRESSGGKGPAGVMGPSGLEIHALASLQQRWGILGTHDSYCTKGMWN